MQVAVRSTVTTGVALIGAGVIAVSPVSPPVPEVAAAAVHSPPITLTATYAELLDNTLSNLGFLYNDLFEEGIAPILQQVAVNQLTMVQDIGAAIHRLFEASNPIGIPATLQTAFDQLAAGQIQEAAETLSTGVILAALPLIPPLQMPINNLVAVIDLIPQVIPLVGIAVISPPLALFQATAEAVQDIVNAAGVGDFTGVFNAVVNAPATILNGVINGYPDNGFPGLIGANGGALGVLVNIRDMILDAITPAAAATATETEEAEPETAAITATKSSAAMTVSLDVTPASTAAAVTGGGDEGDATPATDATDADDATDASQTTDGEPADATDATDADEQEEADGEDAASEPVSDDETEVDDTAVEEGSGSANGGTDLSDGNKATPGGTTGGDSDTQTGGSGDADGPADTDTGSAGGSDSSDSGDSGSGGGSGSE